MRRARDIWIQVIRQFEQSDLTQEEYARQRGIPVGTLRSWIYKLRADAEESAPLLPVRVIGSAALPARRSDGDGSERIEVELGDSLRLRFPPDTSASVVAEWVAALRTRC